MDTKNQTLGFVLDSLTLYDAGESRARTLDDFLHEEGFRPGIPMTVNEVFATIFHRKRDEKYSFSESDKLQLISLAWKVSQERQERLKKALGKALKDNANLRQSDLFGGGNDYART